MVKFKCAYMPNGDTMTPGDHDPQETMTDPQETMTSRRP